MNMMKKSPFFLYVFLVALGVGGSAAAGEYPDPARYEQAIQHFEAADEREAPPKGAIVCIGSSTMRGWGHRIQEDLAPLTVIPRGFGGSNMNDVLHFADRVVIPYEPRAIVLYEGDNDIASNRVPVKDVLRTFDAFFEKVHAALPECRIYVLPSKPSPSRWEHWEKMSALNAALKTRCEENELLTYIDVATPMLGEDGTPKREIFSSDMLHMNDKAYDLWTSVVRPVLMAREAKAE